MQGAGSNDREHTLEAGQLQSLRKSLFPLLDPPCRSCGGCDGDGEGRHDVWRGEDIDGQRVGDGDDDSEDAVVRDLQVGSLLIRVTAVQSTKSVKKKERKVGGGRRYLYLRASAKRLRNNHAIDVIFGSCLVNMLILELSKVWVKHVKASNIRSHALVEHNTVYRVQYMIMRRYRYWRRCERY